MNETSYMILESKIKSINDNWAPWRFSIPTAKISELRGKTITNIEGLEKDNDLVLIQCTDGSAYVMCHCQDCCECVDINDICGDVEDLLNSPITMAEEVIHSSGDDDLPEELKPEDYWESFTWTFYKLATVKGYVTIRWYGESNGYYCEEVEIQRIRDAIN